MGVSSKLNITWDQGRQTVEAQVDAASPPAAVFLFAHGAGAGMLHPFMQGVAEGLVERSITVVRYQFPYMRRLAESGKRWGRPDSPSVLQATVGAVIEWALLEFPGLPIFAGGKSLGGRVTSGWLAVQPSTPETLRGLVFFGFPLHPAGRPAVDRARHLAEVSVPMLFLQGTRDRLADLELMQPKIDYLGSAATLQRIESADHGFQVLKRSGRSDQDVLVELCQTAVTWMLEVTAGER